MKNVLCVLSIKITKFKNMNTFRKQWFGLSGEIFFFGVNSRQLKIILKSTYQMELFLNKKCILWKLYFVYKYIVYKIELLKK